MAMNGPGQRLRRRAARVLAAATVEELTTFWAEWREPPEVTHLREPEAGLVMVQARVGGSGDRFHLGEATVTRAAVVLSGAGIDEAVGVAHVLGSHPEHARIAAIFDGLLVSDALRDRVLAEVILPLEQRQASREAAARSAARSTVVDFFTVARENEGLHGETEDEE